MPLAHLLWLIGTLKADLDLFVRLCYDPLQDFYIRREQKVNKVQKILTAAFFFWGILVMVLGSYGFPYLGYWGVVVGQAIALLFSLTIGILFLFSCFPGAGGDLWDSTYFKFMRGIFGHNWGGYEGTYYDDTLQMRVPRTLQISVCRVTNLSALTLFIFFLGLASYFWSWYLNIMVGFHGLEYIRNLLLPILHVLDVKSMASFGDILFSFAVYQVILFAVLFSSTIILSDGIKVVSGQLHKLFKWFLGVGASASLLVMFLSPFYQYEAWDVLKIYGIIVGSGALCVGIFVGGVYLFVNTNESLRQSVPAQIVYLRIAGWKQRICPLIIQKQKADDSIESKKEPPPR